MSRYIDADKLAREFERHPDRWYFGRDVLREIGDAETVDAEPVRHGRWLRLNEAPEWDQRRCSECGDISCCQRNYCPNCGAKMDGDGDAR